jgi:hypothetical protein
MRKLHDAPRAEGVRRAAPEPMNERRAPAGSDEDTVQIRKSYPSTGITRGFGTSMAPDEPSGR